MMSLFFSLFDTGIPWYVVLCILLVAVSGSVLLCFSWKGNRWESILLLWIAAYFFLMLYSTVLGREVREEAHLQLMPFWSIGAIREGLIEVLYEKIYNVLFFMPYGVLLGAYPWSPKRKAYPQPLPKGKAYPQPLPKGKGGWVWRVVLIGFLTSVGIELLQLITRTGTCETDDVICNTVGCGVGAGMVYGLRFMVYGGLKWFKR